MRILMVASEATPYSKTGGLADVLGALPRALARLGHSVDLVVPAYRGEPAVPVVRRARLALGTDLHEAAFGVIHRDGVRIVPVYHEGFFGRDGAYGAGGVDYPDNPARFALLSRAAIEWAAAESESYDVVHTHDWQAGLVPVLLNTGVAAGTSLTGAVTVHTIHNLAYQGLCDASWLPRVGLPLELMRPDALEFWGRVNYLKGGIAFSDLVTTVSPRYAQEIQTPEYGCGLDGLLRYRSANLVGILNGIDYDEWNPSTDTALVEPFTAKTLDRKAASKRRVLETYGLASDQMARPLVGLVSRLVDQKGFDLIAALADQLPQLDATFVLLGTGDRRYEDLWLALAARHPSRIAVRIGFDERLAHLIEGGADLFLMPSRFEPCGLNQMYSSRYGTLPLVRATGGLADTVTNFDPQTGTGTGFVFEEYSPEALLGTLRWALEVFADRRTWRRMQVAGMARDFSWDKSAQEYVKVYGRAGTRRR